MKKIMRSMTLLVVTIAIVVGLSSDPAIGAIAGSDFIVYSFDGRKIGKIPKAGVYEPIRRLPDRRVKVRYRNLIGYILP